MQKKNELEEKRMCFYQIGNFSLRLSFLSTNLCSLQFMYLLQASSIFFIEINCSILSFATYIEWNCLNILQMGYFIPIFTTIRHFWMLEIIDQYNKAPNQYIDMDHIILAQYYVSNVMGICVFLVWIQIFKYMAFNKTMLQFTLTLRRVCFT